MIYRLVFRSIFLLLVLSFQTTAWAASVGFGHLTIEGREHPLGLDEQRPRFGWQLTSDKQGVKQRWYRLLVARSELALLAGVGDVWDSGEVQTDKSQQIDYQGPKLRPNTDYYWKVQVLTTRGKTEWSKIQHWSTGLMTDSQWKGSWIGSDKLLPGDSDQLKSRAAGRYFRREFQLHKMLKRATVHVSGLGFYTLYLNNKRVGTDWLTPAPTDYRKTVAYNTYDVTSLMRDSNAIGVVVGAGYYYGPRIRKKSSNPIFGLPRLRLNFVIEYQDGTQEVVATDETWKMTTDGPLRYSSIYDGEMYDSQREMKGWTWPHFDDSRWQQATICAAPGGEMRGNVTEPVRVYGMSRPLTINKITDKKIVKGENSNRFRANNRFIVDFGNNGAGVVRLHIKAKKGDTIRVRHAEQLQADGTLYTKNLRSAEATATYIANGDTSIWTPEHTWFGFRYAEISSVDNLEREDVERLLLSDNLSHEGNDIHFTDADTLNLIMEAAYRGVRSNYKGIPMDCPQRDERMPWTGDRTTGCWGESYMLGIQPLYSKWLNDMDDAQRADGALSDVMPAYWPIYNENITWPAVLPFATEMLRRQYGDSRIVARHYGAIDRWLSYVASKALKDNLMTYDKYGDWCVPPENLKLVHAKDPKLKTDGTLISSCYYYYICLLMERYALRLGHNDDARRYAQQAESTRMAINGKFLYHDHYLGSTVTANLLPLAMGIVPLESEEAVKATLLRTIEEQNNYTQSCGVVGIQWLFRYLSEIGRGDIAWRMATATQYPSWGYMIANDATTIWELWNGNTANPSMNSGNHVMLLGDLVPWAYECMAGISSSESQPGFKQAVLAPDFSVDQCQGVDATHQSPYGIIRSAWSRKGRKIHWEVTIPANTTAELHFPDNETKLIESGSYSFDFKL